MVKVSSLLSSLALAGAASAYADPGACSGICNNSHDPSIIRRADGTYFRFSTGGKIAIHTAPALEGPWTYKGAMLPAGSKINIAGKDDLWAPDVQKVGNQYYVYYTVSTPSSQTSALGLATSSSMNIGSWTDHGSIGIQSDPSKRYNAIDANLLQDGGNNHLVFGSFWDGIFEVTMKSNPTAAASSASNVLFDPAGKHPTEGPYLYKRGSFYYLFYSHGKCCGFDTDRPAKGEEYKIMVCRSSSATGKFVDKSGKNCLQGGGTTVLESHGFVYGPGGQGVYDDPSKGPVLYYHYVDTRIGYADGQKKFGWNKLNFGSDGWPTV